MTCTQLNNSIQIIRMNALDANQPTYLGEANGIPRFMQDENDELCPVTTALYCVYGQAYIQAEVIARYRRSPKISLRGGGPKLLNKNHKSDGSPSTSWLVAIPTEAIPILELPCSAMPSLPRVHNHQSNWASAMASLNEINLHPDCICGYATATSTSKCNMWTECTRAIHPR